MFKRVILIVSGLAFVTAAVVAGINLIGPGTGTPALDLPQAASAQTAVRAPAVAGAFYPSDPDELRAYLQQTLESAPPSQVAGRIFGLVAPHAGYEYCASVAAASYRAIRGRHYDSVIVVGPAHRLPVRGAAIGHWSAWETPLGTVPVDAELSAALRQAEATIGSDPAGSAALQYEHSIETQLPWLQVVLGELRFVPLLVSDDSPENCARIADAIASACADRAVLLVASTDLAHYPAYDDCVRSDRRILEAVMTMDPAVLRARDREILAEGVAELHCTMCGLGPVSIVLQAARRLGAEKATIVAQANSGDVPAGDRSHCVGYAAVVFTGPDQGEQTPAEEEKQVTESNSPANQSGGELTEAQRRELLALARETIARYVSGQPLPDLPTGPPIYAEPRAVFVTLHKHGDLRGCIGSLEPREPLAQAVRTYAIAAATEDPRFPPVTAAEVPQLHIEISVLSPLRKIASPDEIVVGKHGVVVRQGLRSGVFLPQVAVEQGWDRDTMLNYLCAHKAGLPMDAWRRGAELYVFTTEVFAEEH